MQNYWLKRRIQRKFREFTEAVYSYIFLTYGHARVSGLTHKEVREIIPVIQKYRDKYGLTVTIQSLLREMMRLEKWVRT
jgi:hypothetical protein